MFIRASVKDQPSIEFSTPLWDINANKELVRLISSTNKEAMSADVAYYKNSIVEKFGKVAAVTVALVDTLDDYNNLVSYTYST